MPPLSAAFVENKVATQSDVERALARQALFGADLATSLIEVSEVREKAMTEVAAAALSLELAAIGPLPPASEAALTRLPRDLATRFAVFPLSAQGDALVLAVSEPLSGPALDEVQRATGTRVTQRYAPLVRVREALSRDYDVPLDRRSQRALARLEGGPDPSPSLAPAPIAETPRLSSLPRAPSLPPIGLPDAQLGPSLAPEPTPPPPAPPQIPAKTVSVAPPPSSKAPGSRPWRKQPTQPGVAPTAGNALRMSSAPTPPQVRLELPSLPQHSDTAGGIPSPTSPPPPAAPAEISAVPGTVPSAQMPQVQSTTPGHFTAQGQFATQGAGTGARPQSLPPRPGGTKKSSSKPARSAGKRHRGPYSAALVEEDLRNAASTSEVLSAFFDFAAQYFEYSALFAVHGDIAEGREAAGPGTDRAGIAKIGVPLDIPSTLARARDQNNFLLERLDKKGLDSNLAKDLRRGFDARALILPVGVRGRCVLLFYGDEGKQDVELSEVGDVLAMAPLVASSLERILAQRKRARDSRAPMQVMASMRPPRFAQPSPQQRASALASALDLAALTPADSTADHAGAMKPATPAARRLTPLVSTPLPPKPQPTPWVGAHPTPVVPGNKPGSSLPPAPVIIQRDAPGKRAPGETVEDDWEIPDDPMPAAVTNSSLRPPKRSSAPLGMSETPQSALKQQQQAADILITALLAGDEQAEAKLADLGVTAAAQVIHRFPGPLAAPTDHKRRASQQGPILRVLARMGELATPFVVARTGDADANVRAWATWLLSELPYGTSMEAICRRLLDQDSAVARAALRSCAELARDLRTRREIAEAMTNLLGSTSVSEDDRFTLVQAIVELKLETAIPRLLRMLLGSPSVTQPAQWALRALACQDFGGDAAAWDNWWTTHRTQSRFEWLVESLAHSTRDLRSNAFAELRELAHHDFGYKETQTAEQIQLVQRRYLEWWKQSHKSATP